MSEKTEEKYSAFRHVWLYAKDWYVKDEDLWKDLRKIVSREVAMQEENVTDGNIIDVVIGVALFALKQSGNVDHTLRCVFSSLFSGVLSAIFSSSFSPPRGGFFFERVLEKCL